MKNWSLLLSLTILMPTIAAAESKLSGTIRVDGSSTVFPITEAMAEEFQKLHPGVRVTVGVSGTGGGFKKFSAGETDISNASRPIKATEMAAAEKNGIAFVELPVAFDGIAVTVNPKNDFVSQLTQDELKRIWEPQSKVKMWSDVRATWPKRKINLYGPGTDSGTFDYFTQAIVGSEGKSRSDFTASEDDNVLIQGVSGDKDALGYFGFAYYEDNKTRLKLAAIGDGTKAILPSVESIRTATYQPLSRPIFIYVSKKSLARPEVDAFVKFYLDQAPVLVPEVKYIPLTSALYDMAKKRLTARKAGTIFTAHGSQVHVTLEDLLKKE